MTSTTVEKSAAQTGKKRFEGKTILVTGGNSGIGLATAKAFAREGGRVIITGRSEKTLQSSQKELGEKSVAIPMDVTNVSRITTSMDEIQRQVGKIDVLFVNAGGGKFELFTEVTEQQFDETFNANVKGAFFTVQRALPFLNDGGAIILNASIAAQMGLATSTVYAASKAALVSFGRTLGAELIGRGIRVNVVSPGPIETPIFEREGPMTEEKKQGKEWFRNQVPLKRFGRSEEVAEAVLFLASSEASFVIGTELVVDGGLIGLR